MMPKVMYKTKDGMKTKMFPYTSKGTEQAKDFAKLVNGKVEMSVKNSKMKYAQKTQKS
jgi:hypothetical protein|tara:strand:- start:2027 stop:2200 length:174 start_codon:yes stop_codon:yes gene_type:complete